MILTYLFHGISNIVHRKRTGRIYLSFGENCLTDNILKRYGLKSFTTPFSYCRSNVEYILDLERNEYNKFLNEEFLSYGELDGKPVSRLNIHLPIENDYHHLHKNGIEFSLHDVIKSQKLRQNVIKRAENLKSFLGKRKYMILYHHRPSSNSNLPMLLEHLLELKKYYSSQEFECQLVLFKQVIIADDSKKNLKYRKEKDIHIFDFYTHNVWGGRNQRNYWAINDDSLIRKMLKMVKTF